MEILSIITLFSPSLQNHWGWGVGVPPPGPSPGYGTEKPRTKCKVFYSEKHTHCLTNQTTKTLQKQWVFLHWVAKQNSSLLKYCSAKSPV